MNAPGTFNPTLQIVGSKTGETREIKGADFHIGRLPNLDLFIDDPGFPAPNSRIVRRIDGAYELVDLKSQNGTVVNGKKLAPHQPRRLHNGDRIKIVELELIFHHASSVIAEPESELTVVLRTINDLELEKPRRALQSSGRGAQGRARSGSLAGRRAELGEMMGQALDGLLAVFPAAERAFIITAQRDGSLLLAAFRSRHGRDSSPTLSNVIRDRVLQGGEAVLIRDIYTEKTWASESLTSTIRSAICVPLRSHQAETLGMLQIDRQSGSDPFGDQDLELMATLALPIGVAIENHVLLRERATWTAARTIQQALLPRTQPRIPGFRFWECYRPAQEVGGDLYDYIAVEPGCSAAEQPQPWAIVVGDVAGKGMPAALISASIRPEIRGAGPFGCRSGRSAGPFEPAALRARARRAVHHADPGPARSPVARADPGQRGPSPRAGPTRQWPGRTD